MHVFSPDSRRLEPVAKPPLRLGNAEKYRLGMCGSRVLELVLEARANLHRGIINNTSEFSAARYGAIKQIQTTIRSAIGTVSTWTFPNFSTGFDYFMLEQRKAVTANLDK